jgi:DNA (cytosine-5)-methyltransferase 1
MVHGSLFSGIGGFDLAAEWNGITNAFHCEWNEFGQKVLKYFWPDCESFSDITKTDFTKYANRIDILSGGFPCQPFSTAGNRVGTDDDLYLWPEMLRAIREIRPAWVIGENVNGIITMEDLQQQVFAKVEGRKIIRTPDIDIYENVYSRNAAMLVNRICEDLEKEGYSVQPFVIPAAAIGAPHRRERIWFVARRIEPGPLADSEHSSTRTAGNSEGNGGKESSVIHATGQSGNGKTIFDNGFCNLPGNESEEGIWDAADSKSDGRTLRQSIDKRGEQKQNHGDEIRNIFIANGEERYAADSDNPRRGQSDEEDANGSSKQFDGDRLQQNDPDAGGIGLQRGELLGSVGETRPQPGNKQPGRFLRPNWEKFPTQSPVCGGNDGIPAQLDGITFSKWRAESIKGYGNAIVPQVAAEIMAAILVVEEAIKNGEV